jgi:hypothetical protein
MTKRQATVPAPGPLETYARAFDPLFSKVNQRTAFRRYLEGLLLPAERNKTLTALANAEPIVGAQEPAVQAMQWFLSESTWDAQALNQRRVELLCADPTTAPDADGVLVIDETGDRKWGSKTAHVGRQYLGSIGKVDNGVVSVTSLWADAQVYYPLAVEPFTPKQHFPRGLKDPDYRTKPQIAVELVTQAVTHGIPFRAVVADSFYGENETFRSGLARLGLGYVLALKPSHTWWALVGTANSLEEAARAATWEGTDTPGAWQPVQRAFRDGHIETWWALEITSRALWAVQAPTRRGRDDGPNDLAGTEHLVSDHQSAGIGRHRAAGRHTGPGRPGRDCPLVRPAELGRTKLQAGERDAGLERLPSAQRPRDPPALGTGLLCLYLLLVGREPGSPQRRRRPFHLDRC